MKFQAIYRASFYLMLTFATLVLSIDATADNRFAMLYPLAVAFVGVLAFLTVDRNPKLAPPRGPANVVALFTGLLSLAEYQYDNNLLLLAAAHWLVYLQLIKMFLPKTVEDDWFLFLLGLVQVLVGGVMSQSDKVGVALFCWALLSLWVLTLFSLHREALRMRAVPMASSAAGGDRAEPYRGLIDAAFAVSTARVAATTLALGGLIFLAMPRRSTMGSSQGTGAVGKHLTGFDDEVQLGQLGEILENDNVVMTVDLVDRENRRLPHDPDAEYRWRGVSMDSYRDGRWSRPKMRLNNYKTIGLSGVGQDGPIVRQLVKLEATDSPILFALRPIVDCDAPDKRFQPEINEIDGSAYRGNTRAVSLDYQIDSSTRPDLPQPGEVLPSDDYRARLLNLPGDVRRRIHSIALERVGKIDEADLRGRAAALEHYLRESGEFKYSLSIVVTDPNLDPVLDFLDNQKSGHCEYFASALTLLLRSVGIPARMVNGFKGGDYNAISGLYTVRQKHAHSWVEALVGDQVDPSRERRPTWVTLDPTPADQRNASVARVGGIASNFRQVTDLIRYVWIFYIVGFNSERQDRFLYGPLRELIKEAKYGFALIGDALRGWLSFPNFESFFSLRGFLVSFAGLLLLAGLVRLAAWGARRVFRRLSGRVERDADGLASIAFYRKLVTLLAGLGVVRPSAETPREFAARAALFLAARGSGTEAVADVPPLVVDAFYRIRFGDHTIGDDDLTHVTARLDALEAHLRAEPA